MNRKYRHDLESLANESTVVKQKIQLVLYYKNHNVDETLREFGVSKSSLFRYVRKYDGTEASLINGRTNPKKRVPFTDEEEKCFLDSLQVYNSPNCERYVIAPSYKEVYTRDLFRRD